jgi:hypothetical protein
LKDSKKYSKKVASFFKQYKSKTTLKPFENEDKVDTLVFSVLYEHLSIDDAQSCADLMRKQFVDWNDLRVSRMEEVLDVLSPANLPVEKKKAVAQQLIKSLNCVFDKYDRISFEDIDELGKRQANQELTTLEAFTPFMIDFLMLNFKGSHSLPINASMAEYARKNALVHPDSQDSDVSSFLQRQISVDDVYDFYLTLRQQCESAEDEKAAAAQAESKPAAGKKTSAKTTKKKPSAKKSASKKAPAKKTATKKTVKATVKKAAVKKKVVKKTAAKKTSKRPVAKKTVKKSAGKKSSSKK